MTNKLDELDHRILRYLQQSGDLSQRQISERVGLSQNAGWRRIKRLQDMGILCGYRAIVDPKKLGFTLVVLVQIKTQKHSVEWFKRLKNRAEAIPEIADMYRIGGEWDYFLRIICRDIGHYDSVYQQLISGLELENVTAHFAMECVFSDRPVG